MLVDWKTGKFRESWGSVTQTVVVIFTERLTRTRNITLRVQQSSALGMLLEKQWLHDWPRWADQRVIYTLTDTKNDVRCPTFKTLSRDREWQGDVQPGSHRGTRKRKFDDSSYHSSQRFWYGTRRKGNPLTSFACVSKRLKKVPSGCLWQGDFTPRQATFHTRCSLWAGAKGNLLSTKKLTKTKVQLPRTSKQNFLQALHWSSKTKMYSSHYNSKMAHA